MAEEFTKSGRRPRGYWDTHGGMKAKNQECWEKRKAKLAAQGLNTDGKPLKKKAAKTPKPMFPEPGELKPEGAINREAKPAIPQTTIERHVSQMLDELPWGLSQARTLDAVDAFTMSKCAGTRLVQPSPFSINLVHLVDSLQPHHLSELDQAIIENQKRGEALQLMRDVVAVKCMPPQPAFPPAGKTVPPPPQVEKPKRKYNKKRTNTTAEGVNAKGNVVVRPAVATDCLKVPSPEEVASMPSNGKPNGKKLSPAELAQVDVRRRMVVEFLHENGNEETRPVFLMGECAIPGAFIEVVLDHPWFRRDRDGVRLSDQGMTVAVTKEYSPAPPAEVAETA